MSEDNRKIIEKLFVIVQIRNIKKTNPLFEHLETAEAVGAGWYRMARYGVGSLAALPSLLLLFPAERRRVIAERYLSNAVLFGFGVAVGYVIDMFLRKK